MIEESKKEKFESIKVCRALVKFINDKKIPMNIFLNAISYLFAGMIKNKTMDEENLREFYRHVIETSKTIDKIIK